MTQDEITLFEFLLKIDYLDEEDGELSCFSGAQCEECSQRMLCDEIALYTGPSFSKSDPYIKKNYPELAI